MARRMPGAFSGFLISACLLIVLLVPVHAAGSAGSIGLANNTWYFAEGTTRAGFDEWITLQNPGDDRAHVTITFMMADGYNLGKGLDVAGHSRTTLSVRDIVGPGRDVSARISSDRPVVAERPLYFNYNDVWNGGECAIGATDTSTTWYFPEGTTRADFDEYLCILNPGEETANIHIEYMTPGSVNYFQDASAAPRSRITIKARDTIQAEADVSVKLTSTQPVVVERPIYYNFMGAIPGGDNVVGVNSAQKNWFFAEGYTAPDFWTYLCVQNPGDSAAEVRVYYLRTDGQVLYNEFSVGSKSRLTVDPRLDIGDAEFSMVVDATQPVVAERVMYFLYGGAWPGGHDVMGASAPGKEVYFAEGTTQAGFVEWVCIMNPNNDPANVTFEVQVEGSAPIITGYKVAPRSRYTAKMNDTVGPNKNISITVTADVAVVVERPMYFDYQGKWRGGHCVVGYMP